MALQGIWSGTISFSLVAIPVQLVRAVTPGRISFRLLHSTDYSSLMRRMFCPQQGKMVPAEEIVRGYEIGPDHYLPITDEELESVSPERSRTIEISEFIDMAEVDPLYYGHPYYLAPLKGGEKAYRLLAEAMRQTNRAGLARFVLTEREYLVAVRSTEGALSLVTLHYSEELLPAREIAPNATQGAATMKSRIKGSIKRMIAEFEPEKYADSRRTKVLDLLKRKVEGQTPVEAPPLADEEGEGPPDLVATLETAMADLRKKR
jgi:DNA end-binding protein Ku